MNQTVNYTISNGYARPYGVNMTPEGVNFAIFSKHATSVTLCLFELDKPNLLAEINLDPIKNKTGNVWHILVKDLPETCSYSYRFDGPKDVKGYFVDPQLLLLDPYAKAVNTPNVWGQNISIEEAKTKTAYNPRGVIRKEEPFDWQGVENPSIPAKDLIIYEMHVRGMTQHPSSNVTNKGTFLGIIEKIPHFLELGVNALELLPSQEFNEMELPRVNPKTKELLYNYWGYSTVNFFSLMNRYAADPKPGAVINEFKTMVRELHRNGIEVILDVVFNHTAEALGVNLSYRGIENAVYYMLNADGAYLNFSGCGNTFNCNNPIARELIIECLRYFVIELHVDGFRFDLASVLTRDPGGMPLGCPPLIEALTVDPIFSKTRLIAEPWDVGGLYQVGSFYPYEAKWAEWNGKFRDTTRRFIKGAAFEKHNFASRITGSQDLYGNGRLPANSINFLTAHDGFTLADLVSYNQKHNSENGEDNRDGFDANDSWNSGAEGPSQNKKIIQLRQQQMRNFILALMVSQGVPMIIMGDEYGHTRHGNNNTWGQDNELNWFLWDEIKNHADFYRFYTKVIQLRKNNEIFRKGSFLTAEDIDWHGLEPMKANWGADDHFLAFTLKDPKAGQFFYIAFNASHLPINLTLAQPPEGKAWRVIVDTHSAPPQDFLDEKDSLAVKGNHYRVMSYSSIVLKAL